MIEKQKSLSKLKYKNSKKTNILRRISINFFDKLREVNESRESKGLKKLSVPFMTELIINHNKSWKIIENDLILYDTDLDFDYEDVTEDKEDE